MVLFRNHVRNFKIMHGNQVTDHGSGILIITGQRAYCADLLLAGNCLAESKFILRETLEELKRIISENNICQKIFLSRLHSLITSISSSS